jgi:hypothetical protein
MEMDLIPVPTPIHAGNEFCTNLTGGQVPRRIAVSRHSHPWESLPRFIEINNFFTQITRRFYHPG